MKCQRDVSKKKRKIKTMNSKMTTNAQLSTPDPKTKTKNNKKLGKQLEQEQNHRNGDHMEGYQKGGGEWGERYRK